MNKGILLTLLFALPLTTHAGTKKCTGPDGAVFFTQTTCPASTTKETPEKSARVSGYKFEILVYEIREYCADKFGADPGASGICYTDQVRALTNLTQIRNTYPGEVQQRKISRCQSRNRPNFIKALSCTMKALQL